MKETSRHTRILLAAILLLLVNTSSAQGRVVINEYLPWPSNGCGATAEFVELMNFGPGPVNIGCYILTDGDYSVTIPANTILQPGQFYVIAGQDIIAAPCANIDSTIHAQLNWNTCNCTSGPIPTTGDGFFTDGGSANEQVVLLDPSLHVVDAVIRDLPAEPSSLITTHALSGCSSQSFNLDLMTINYELLGMSTGRGNSFARKLDGDCGWVKDPQQSAHATNNTPGVTSDVVYDFSYTQAMDCSDNHGGVEVFVKRSNYVGYFPMYYTLAFDHDSNGVYDFTDTYTSLVDSTPPDIRISGLPTGTYRLTVESSKGCDLATFDFTILPCYPILPVKLVYFRTSPAQRLEWLLNDVENLATVTLEKAAPNGPFVPDRSFSPGPHSTGEKYFSVPIVSSTALHFRLKLVSKNGTVFYSPVIGPEKPMAFTPLKIGPNPVTDLLSVGFHAGMAENLPYTIYNVNGTALCHGNFSLRQGPNSFDVNVATLPAGIYFLHAPGRQPISFRFVKHSH